jgi:hypothetical protein
MINTIIFDFGDVFINLNKTKVEQELQKLGLTQWNDNLNHLNYQYEIGAINEMEFLSGFQKEIPHIDPISIKKAWNSILVNFPLYRLEFLEQLASKYKLFLLSTMIIPI